MRVIYFGNNRLGATLARYLLKDIVAIVLHPSEKRKGVFPPLHPPPVFDGSKLDDADVFDSIAKLYPDIGVSVLFDYIFRKEFIDIFPHGIINLHPAFLPYNRGQYPNVWSIIDGTPTGVTLHYVDEEIDMGGIIARREIPVYPTDTGETLYRRLEKESEVLFRRWWPKVKEMDFFPTSQERNAGTYHRTRDVDAIDEIHLDREYIAQDLIDLIRARTFEGFRGAYFRHDGKKIFLRLVLEEE